MTRLYTWQTEIRARGLAVTVTTAGATEREARLKARQALTQWAESEYGLLVPDDLIDRIYADTRKPAQSGEAIINYMGEQANAVH